MRAKINFGMHNVTTDFNEPKELESTIVEFPDLTIEVTKDQGELVVTSAINTLGNEVIDEMTQYCLNIEYL